MTIEDIKDELVDMIAETAAKGDGKRLGVLKYAYMAVSRQQEYPRYSYRQASSPRLFAAIAGGSLDADNRFCSNCGAKLLGTFDD